MDILDLQAELNRHLESGIPRSGAGNRNME
jgi:hypothetical protein